MTITARPPTPDLKLLCPECRAPQRNAHALGVHRRRAHEIVGQFAKKKYPRLARSRAKLLPLAPTREQRQAITAARQHRDLWISTSTGGARIGVRADIHAQFERIRARVFAKPLAEILGPARSVVSRGAVEAFDEVSAMPEPVEL